MTIYRSESSSELEALGLAAPAYTWPSDQGWGLGITQSTKRSVQGLLASLQAMEQRVPLLSKPRMGLGCHVVGLAEGHRQEDMTCRAREPQQRDLHGSPSAQYRYSAPSQPCCSPESPVGASVTPEMLTLSAWVCPQVLKAPRLVPCARLGSTGLCNGPLWSCGGDSDISEEAGGGGLQPCCKGITFWNPASYCSEYTA